MRSNGMKKQVKIVSRIAGQGGENENPYSGR